MENGDKRMFRTNATILPRLMNCNGSHKMEGALAPFVSGGQEGETAKYAAAMLASNSATPDKLRDVKAPNGFFITDEIIAHVSEYVTAIRQEGATFNQVNCDVSFNAEKWHLDAFADHIAFSGTTLYIDKLAFGFGIIEPENNWEMLAYAFGWWRKYGMLFPNLETVVMTIHQPRASHPLGQSREWIIEGRKLVATYGKSICEVLAAPSAQLRTGLTWCRKCPAIARCPAAREASMNAVDVSISAQTENLTIELLEYEITCLEQAKAAIKNRLEMLENDAAHRLKSGGVMQNYIMKSGLTNRKWPDGMTAEMLMMLMGKDLSVKKLITPAQAIVAGVSETAVNAIARRETTAPKLTRVDPSKLAQRSFGKKGN